MNCVNGWMVSSQSVPSALNETPIADADAGEDNVLDANASANDRMRNRRILEPPRQIETAGAVFWHGLG